MVMLRHDALPAWRGPSARETSKAWSPNRGPIGILPGLANLGNTCFANSVLQCLLNTPGKFVEHCLSLLDKDDEPQDEPPSKKAALGRCLEMLAREYGSRAGTALHESNPALRNLNRALVAIDPKRAGNQQQDAYEFLGWLLEGLEEECKSSPSKSDSEPGPGADVINAVCGIRMDTRRHCHACGDSFKVDSITDTALRLPLITPEAQQDAALRSKQEHMPITLEELIQTTRQPETVEGYDCDTCRRRSAERGAEHEHSTITQHAGVISTTTDVLIIVLYRFMHTVDSDGNFHPMKVTRQVAFPMELTMETGVYSLFGAVSHLGASLSAGHYVAAVRSRRDDFWYECNDEQVVPLSLPQLYDGRSLTTLRSGAEPYILFYHRRPKLMDITDFLSGLDLGPLAESRPEQEEVEAEPTPP